MKTLLVGLLFLAFLAFLRLADVLTLRRKAYWGQADDEDEL